MSCDAVQERLALALLGRTTAGEDDAAHAARCAECGRAARELRAARAHLDSVQVPALRPAARAGCETRALRTLRAQRAARTPAPLRGLGPDLARALVAGLLALPVAAGHAWLVAWAGRTLLAPWLPASVLGWLGIVYFAPVALALAVLYGAIPLAVVAGRRAPLEDS